MGAQGPRRRVGYEKRSEPQFRLRHSGYDEDVVTRACKRSAVIASNGVLLERIALEAQLGDTWVRGSLLAA
jgi:hypothetical protein